MGLDEDKQSKSCNRQRIALDTHIKEYIMIREKNEHAFDYMNLEVDLKGL